MFTVLNNYNYHNHKNYLTIKARVVILHGLAKANGADFAGVKHRNLKGLDPRINSDKPTRIFRDAMKALDKQAWAEAYNLEYLGFVERGVFKVVKPEQGVRIHDTIARLEYKEDNGPESQGAYVRKRG